MKIYEELTVKVIERRKAKEECRCDRCKKMIYKRSCLDSEELPSNSKVVCYWEVTIGHNDWGTDSGDSVEHHYICSPDCMRQEMDAYIARSNNDINTEYMEVEHVRTWCYEVGEGMMGS